MAVTITDVANYVGVSRCTVSKALRGVPRVGDQTKQRVLKAAAELGFTPNAAGRGLALRKTETIGVALHDLEYISLPYFSTIIGGVGQSIGSHDYNLHFTITNKSARGGRENLHFMRKVRQRRLDGLVIIDQAVADSDILELEAAGMPFVLVDRDIAGEKVNFVMTDNRAGMHEAAEHLIELGHRRIAFLHEPLSWYSIGEMLAGYRSALTKYGLKYDERLVKYIGDVVVDTTAAAAGLWRLPEPPTAVLALSDQIALGVIAALRKSGKRVPQDVAVIGYDDVARVTQPVTELTSVRVPLQQMGEAAGDMLLQIVNGQVPQTPGIVLQPELIVRESSGGPLSK